MDSSRLMAEIRSNVGQLKHVRHGSTECPVASAPVTCWCLPVVVAGIRLRWTNRHTLRRGSRSFRPVSPESDGRRLSRDYAPSTRPTMPASADRQAWLDQFARGYFPGRSGQIFLVPREGDFVVDRDPLYVFMHGSPWKYDTHVPLLFHGAPFVKQSVSNDFVTQQDIVPTLAALLGTVPPATAVGQPLRQALAPLHGRYQRTD
jgi:hypothetical protein